jgi:hypothetical protein
MTSRLLKQFLAGSIPNDHSQSPVPRNGCDRPACCHAKNLAESGKMPQKNQPGEQDSREIAYLKIANK